jgi:hypothetical protein
MVVLERAAALQSAVPWNPCCDAPGTRPRRVAVIRPFGLHCRFLDFVFIFFVFISLNISTGEPPEKKFGQDPKGEFGRMAQFLTYLSTWVCLCFCMAFAAAAKEGAMNLVDLGAKVSDEPLTYVQAMQVLRPDESAGSNVSS